MQDTAPTSTRSIGFCVTWVCIRSSSSSSQISVAILPINQDLKNNPGAPIRLSLPHAALELPALVIDGERSLVAARRLFFVRRRAWWA